jgi:CubicO group peptidase (beta-lactamase class C family)
MNIMNIMNLKFSGKGVNQLNLLAHSSFRLNLVKVGMIGFCLGTLLLFQGCGNQTTGSSDEQTDRESQEAAEASAGSSSETESSETEASDPELSQEIDELVADTLVPNGPGVAVLVVDDGEVVQSKGYGLSDVTKKTPITADTAFDLASVSKQMTAMAILMLMEDEELALDDSVSDYLTEFKNPDPEDPILISDLLYHISGLADYSEDWEGSDQDLAKLTLEDHLKWINQQEPYDDRGVAFEYNNGGYALLALIVQRVSGKPFSQFMKERIFEPLGMTHTVVFDLLDQKIANQANGYIVSNSDKVEPSSLPTVIAGDGNIFSSISDLAKYDAGLRDGELVEEETLELAFTAGELDDGSAVEDDETEYEYGAGWEIDEDYYVEHSGSWYGTSTFYRHYLDDPITIIVLSNDENYDGESLTDEIADLLDL